MSYLIIVLVLLLAIAPLLQFLPTRRQKQITAFREMASECGLYVEFRKEKFFKTLIPRVDQDFSDIIFYGLRQKSTISSDEEAVIWVRDSDGWSNYSGHGKVPAILDEFPDSVLVATIEFRCCGVYWTEQGALQDVRNLARILTTLCVSSTRLPM